MVPIKHAFELCLRDKFKWGLQEKMDIPQTGKVDAMRTLPGTKKQFAVEWETGNISSSHRALNKIALGILEEKLLGGALIVPSRKLYNFLTDRIGNFSEISTYFPVWARLNYDCECVISVFEVEHDAESHSVPCIPKGKDGMALGLVASRATENIGLKKSPPELF